MTLPLATLIATIWILALSGQALALAALIPMPARTMAVRRTIPLHLAATSSSPVQERLFNLNLNLEGTEFEVMLDTGSSDLWIDTSTSNIASLIDANRSGIVDTGAPALLEYGVDGGYTYARGTVQYGDMHLSGPIGMSARNQSFVNVPGTTNITQFGNSGILGLRPYDSWSAIRETMQGTAWGTDLVSTTMFREDPTVDKMFALSFSSRDATGIIHNGTLNFGDVDPVDSAVLSSPRVPLMTGSFWDVPSQGFFVDGQAVRFGDPSEELTIILDSGVYGVLAPPEYVEAIFSRIPGSTLLGDGTWNVPCDTKMNVAVSLGSSIFPIHPIDMTEVYGMRDGQPLCKSLFVSNTDRDLPFLVGLGVMKSLVVLHHFGESATSGPYLQMMSVSAAASICED
ncbi:aspartic peptidase domain-containing protein [Daedaleopsis nitida]|nr:aspartic peptidase domain-containing protein [Daedaleopsis nitida]